MPETTDNIPGVVGELVPSTPPEGPEPSAELVLASEVPGGFALPVAIHRAGEQAQRRFLEFFAATIRNKNTREAYARAVCQFFTWLEERGLTELSRIEPMVAAAYVEMLTETRSAPTAKQHLAAIRKLFDWLVTGQVLESNPATSVKGPTHIVSRGSTPVLTADEARSLLDSIDVSGIVGLRDRALIAVMVYSFARVSAVVRMETGDYYCEGKKWWFRLREKGGKTHDVPAHHRAFEYVEAYLDAAGIREQRDTPLFRSASRHRVLTENALSRRDALAMIKRRAKKAGLSPTVCCHTFRATGITAYLDNGGTIENAQAIAAHASPRTTKLYDRTSDDITLDEVERISI